VAPPAWPPLAQAAARALLPALMQPPRLAVLAAQLGQPARSFQRALASAGLSYTRLLAETRRRAAAWWLLYSAVPLAEVGFIAGYADQAHFTRDFQRHVGLTPARYRLEFAGPAS